MFACSPLPVSTSHLLHAYFDLTTCTEMEVHQLLTGCTLVRIHGSLAHFKVGTVSVHTCFGNLQIRLSSLSVVSFQLCIPNALLMTKFNTAHCILTYRRGGSRSASDWLHSVGGQESPAHFLQILALLSINQCCNRISRRSITFSNFLLFTAPLRSSDLDLSAAGFYLHSTCSSYAH